MADDNADQAAQPGQEPAQQQPETQEQYSARVQKRMDELTAKYREQERINRYLSEQLQQVQQQGSQTRQSQPAASPAQYNPADGPPREDQFDSYTDFTSAVAKYHADQAKREILDQQRQSQQEAAQQAKIDADRRKVEAAAAQDAEFAAARNNLTTSAGTPVIPYPSQMYDAVMESDKFPEVVKFLGTNLEEAHRIAGLSPSQQAKAIGRIEDRITAQPPQAKKPEPTHVETPGGGIRTSSPPDATLQQQLVRATQMAVTGEGDSLEEFAKYFDMKQKLPEK